MFPPERLSCRPLTPPPPPPFAPMPQPLRHCSCRHGFSHKSLHPLPPQRHCGRPWTAQRRCRAEHLFTKRGDLDWLDAYTLRFLVHLFTMFDDHDERGTYGVARHEFKHAVDSLALG